MESWFCLQINASSHYGKSNVVVEELEKILSGKQKPKFIVIEDPEIKKSGEYMVFLSSNNFLQKKEEILRFSAVLRCVENGGKPYSFSDLEVKRFVKSIEKTGSEAKFSKGDVVLVREGYLKNLHGLVCGKNRDGSKIRVKFRFYIRDIMQEFIPKQLKREKSIYDDMPINFKRNEWFTRFSENKTTLEGKSE